MRSLARSEGRAGEDPGPVLARADHPGLDRWLPRVLGLGLALLVLAPLLRPAYVLSYDMVFVPHPAIGPRTLGLDGSVPRAVPADFVVAVLSAVVPGWVVQQAALLAVPVIAVLGAWRASPARSLAGAALSAVVYLWSPYVAERLAIGHWSLLLGYAVLPWLVVAGRRLHGGERGAVWMLVALAGACAVAAPTAAVLGTVLAAVLLLSARSGARTTWAALGGLAVVNLPWVLPGLVTTTTASDPAAGTESFAARADSVAGGLVSVVTSGGIWNTLVVPSGRGTWTAAVVGLTVVLVAAVGARTILRGPDSRVHAVVLTLGVVGLVLAAGSLAAPGRTVSAWVAGTVPGGGILRDAQKWLAWWSLAVALTVGPGLEALTGQWRREVRRPLAIAALLLPLVTLPGLAWGVGGHLRPVSWPSDVERAAERLDAAPDGAAMVLPWHQFRAWSWNHDRTTLDPWQRLVGRRVVVNDELELVHRTVPGEDPLAGKVSRLLDDGTLTARSARKLGIRYVVIDRRTAGDQAGVQVFADAGSALYRGPDVEVRDLGPVHHQGQLSRWLVAPDILAGLAFAGVCAMAARARRRLL